MARPIAHFMDESANQTSLPVRLGEAVKLTLDANPTTGYRWTRPEYMTVDKCQNLSCSLFDIQEEYVQDPAPAGMCGVGGKTSLVITPKKAGTHALALVYCQVWEGPQADAGHFTVTFNVTH